MREVTFIAKTNLNNDGRILNEIKILQDNLPDIFIDFILLPDKPLLIDLGKSVKIRNVNLSFRHNKLLRFFTVFEFTVKTLIILFKLKPKVLHVQDSAVVLPCLIYRILKNRSFTLIYDDHEIPNENQSLGESIYTFFEAGIMRRADYIVFANEERMEILKEKYHLKAKCSYFLNLPYFEYEAADINDVDINRKLNELDTLREHGTKLIIHQGVINVERGRDKLAKFASKLPDGFKILILGVTEADFEKFISEFNLSKNSFYFVGSVNYLLLPQFWNRGMASIVMYLPTYINNRLCAPNRLYISIQKGLPVIVNKNNPVLSNFIKKYKCGFFIEDFIEGNTFESIIKLNDGSFNFDFTGIKREQINSFLSIYNK